MVNLPRIQAYVSVAIGAALIIVGVVQQQKKKKLLQEGIETEGEIIDVIGDSSKNANGTPVIKFVTKNETIITQQYNANISFKKKGSSVKLVYDASNPKNFIVKEILG